MLQSNPQAIQQQTTLNKQPPNSSIQGNPINLTTNTFSSNTPPKKNPEPPAPPQLKTHKPDYKKLDFDSYPVHQIKPILKGDRKLQNLLHTQ